MSQYYDDYERVFCWTRWYEVERSFALANAYKKNYLFSKDIEPFLNASRLSNITNWTAPVAVLFLLDKTVFKAISKSFGSTMPIKSFLGLKVATAAIFTVGWLNYNPFYIKSLDEKLKLLQLAYKRVGNMNLQLCNDTLPRYMTEQEANRKMRKIYNERNSIWTGILYNRETRGGVKLDDETKFKLPITKVVR